MVLTITVLGTNSKSGDCEIRVRGDGGEGGGSLINDRYAE